MDQEDYPTKIEVLLIGEPNVGKTSIILSFMDGKFDEIMHFNIGTRYKYEQITIDGRTVNMTIWDTIGQERSGSVSPNYFRDVQGAIFVYDVTDKKTFDELTKWLMHLHTFKNDTNPVKIIVGNKIDLPDRKVSTAEGLKFAENHEALYTECSAITSDGVEGCFEKLVREILKTPGVWGNYPTGKFGSAIGGAPIRLGNDQVQKILSTCCNSN